MKSLNNKCTSEYKVFYGGQPYNLLTYAGNQCALIYHKITGIRTDAKEFSIGILSQALRLQPLMN
jgi:hypothetical protein